MYMNMWKESKILKKAVEYHSCRGNRKWVKGANGEHSCQCAVTCKNGGKMIKDTCTCECKGDLFHGFKGVECGEDFGSRVRLRFMECSMQKHRSLLLDRFQRTVLSI